MKSVFSTLTHSRALCSSLFLLGGALAANGITVYSEDFTGQTSLSSDFTVTTQPGVTYGVSTTEGNPAPSMSLVDTGSSYGSAYVQGSHWNSFGTGNPGEHIFQVSWDWRVDASTSAIGSNSTMRFNLSLSATGATGSKISVGFGHATINGTDTNFFYAGGASAAPFPSSANAIGFNGTTLDDGFNFGAYSTTGSENNTDGNYYRFTLTYADNATTAELTVYNTADESQSATVTITGLTPTSVYNTNGRSFEVVAGGAGTGTSYFDNIELAAIPEISSTSAMFAMASLLTCWLFKRRRSR
ncbi:MAG: hypothetical protein Q7Q73_12630 [Verrucomicrobiota bacterium JB024]|nr:hypothetical protein [Verrucomicrobiota bacterium JB024]